MLGSNVQLKRRRTLSITLEDQQRTTITVVPSFGMAAIASDSGAKLVKT